MNITVYMHDESSSSSSMSAKSSLAATMARSGSSSGIGACGAMLCCVGEHDG